MSIPRYQIADPWNLSHCLSSMALVVASTHRKMPPSTHRKMPSSVDAVIAKCALDSPIVQQLRGGCCNFGRRHVPTVLLHLIAEYEVSCAVVGGVLEASGDYANALVFYEGANMFTEIDADAACAAGIIYFGGFNVVTISYKDAVRCFKAAKRHGNTRALSMLVMCNVVETRLVDTSLVSEAEKKECSEQAVSAGQLLHCAINWIDDKVHQFLNLRVSLGDVVAQHLLGEQLVLWREHESGLTLLRNAAAVGYAPAQATLGDYHLDWIGEGRGTSNKPKGFEFLVHAADQGHWPSINRLEYEYMMYIKIHENVHNPRRYSIS